ncbi:MAG: dihydropteroate synthase [Candidatus Helarchaeota archaeon]
MSIKTIFSGLKVGDNHPIKILGIINLSRESFYKQSITTKKSEVSKKVEKFINEGVDFIDIGARSTAPGVKPISVQEEMDRLIPILKFIRNNYDIPISIDTQYSKIAEKSLSLGADIINDVSGFKTDTKIMSTIIDHNADTIIMASNKVPGDCLGINDSIKALQQSISAIEKLGYNSKKIVIDPSIGRWIPSKIAWYNLELLDQLAKFRQLNKPILVSISRKSFVGDILNYPDPKDRLIGTLACTSIAVYNGAHIIRTHDVKETRDVVDISWKLKNYAQFLDKVSI